MLLRKSISAPCSPTIMWSQWMLLGTAVDGRLQLMNCSRAICAEASCIATRSTSSLRLALPRTSRPPFVFDSSDSSAFSPKWL